MGSRTRWDQTPVSWGRFPTENESDYVKIAHAIGRNLREEYAAVLKEPLPSDLRNRLKQLLDWQSTTNSPEGPRRAA